MVQSVNWYKREEKKDGENLHDNTILLYSVYCEEIIDVLLLQSQLIVY